MRFDHDGWDKFTAVLPISALVRGFNRQSICERILFTEWFATQDCSKARKHCDSQAFSPSVG